MTVHQETSRPVADELGVVAHYDEAYFAYQQECGEFNGWALTPMFTPYVSSGDRVVDFGCGGGYVLKNLKCAEKIGIEINDVARNFAQTVNGIRTVKSTDEIPEEWADVIISNHALEHCASPFKELVGLLTKLKPGGIFVCYVPHESITNPWKPGSVDNHLYTWNPMTLGNLFAGAGYSVEHVGGFYHIWPPFYTTVAKAGPRLFNWLSFAYGTLRKHNSQVRIVARRPVSPAPRA
jgi:SAM-dependent methyltransferase